MSTLTTRPPPLLVSSKCFDPSHYLLDEEGLVPVERLGLGPTQYLRRADALVFQRRQAPENVKGEITFIDYPQNN